MFQKRHVIGTTLAELVDSCDHEIVPSFNLSSLMDSQYDLGKNQLMISRGSPPWSRELMALDYKLYY